MNAAQQDAARRVVASALRLAKAHVNEARGSNLTIVTDWWNLLWGWGEGSPWCAMGASMIGADAGVLAKADMSAGAWALVEHLANKPGGRIHAPEPGCLIAYSWGSGHVETCIKDLGGGYVLAVGCNTSGGTGSAQEGDGCYLVKRYLPGSLHSVPYARHPGVVAGHARAGVPAWFGRDLVDRTPNKDLLTGPDVRHVQQRLGVHVDGAFGPKTAGAVKGWQAHHGITADGSVRDATAIMLG